MSAPRKSSVEEIQARFESATEVERFSNLETGQSSAVDAPLCLDLITEVAAAVTPNARRLLDVGCGAGNFTLQLLRRLPDLDVILLDLSRPMLDRAEQRIRAAGIGRLRTIQGDTRSAELGNGAFDIILAGAVLHHLRSDDEWQAVFARFFRALTPGGAVWIFDLIRSELPVVQALTWQRYGRYLEALKGAQYRDDVLAYIDREDTPRSLVYQLDLLRAVGFEAVEVLHKNCCFAAFGAVKGE
jgi:tRNA (cmo5U34)-methyltransferase